MSDVITDSLIALELPFVLDEVAVFAQSVSGKLRVKQCEPETDSSIIKDHLDLTREMKEVVSTRGSFGFSSLAPLKGVFERLRGISVLLDPEEMIAVRELLNITYATKRAIEDLDDRFKRLKKFGNRLNLVTTLRTTLRKTLDEHGSVRPDASPELTLIHREIINQRGKINKRLDAVIKNQDMARIVQEDYITLRNDRYVILLRPEFKGLLSGIVHDHSRSGASVYVEPFEVVEDNNRMASLADEEREAVIKVYRWLTEEIKNSIDELSENFETLTGLDSYQAKAEYAIRMDCHAPELTPLGFRIIGARHPLLLAAKDVDVVPMDIVMDSDTIVTIISGPNMGGKTVALKIAGLFPLMARCGLLLPAKEGSKIQPFSRIMVDIGDEQNIRGKVSSFSGHISKIKAILEFAQPGDLVLLDELGGFTDPDEGAALAMAIIDELRANDANVFVTTHLTQLKAYALSTSGTKNVSVEFHPITLKPTFKLLYDLPGDSHAITTAESIGLPRNLIERARTYADRAAGGSTALLTSLREKLISLDSSRKEHEILTHRLKQELIETSERRNEIVDKFRKEASDLIKKAEQDLSSLRRSIKTGQIKSGKEIHAKFQEVKSEIAQKLQIPLSKPRQYWEEGSLVRIQSLGKQGFITSAGDRGKMDVLVGKITVRTDSEDLILIKKPDQKKKPSKKTIIGVETAATVGWEINVIGMRVDEAIPVVEKSIDNAILGGLTSLRIIHGKGTGRLRQAIAEYLSTHGMVLGYQSGSPQEGGAGATIVNLRPE
ncbi:MAG: endonuclease MutS2 [Pseudomonadota bacterium]